MGWDQLKSMIDENREAARLERAQPPTVCPFCGDVLHVSQRGVRNCKWGHYRWEG